MRRNKNRTAFTLIELLVVIAIISMLVGLVSVGLRKTSITAKNLRQKSVLRGMDVGLELFAKDFDGYPDSKRLPASGSGPLIIGAQRLAEAIVGRDGKGFDPATDWYAPDDSGATGLYTDTSESMKRRKDLYLEFKYFEAHTLDEIYPNTDPIFTKNGSVAAPILTDVYNKHVHTTTGKRIGSPILYFKADRSKREWEFRGNIQGRNGATQVDPEAPDWPDTIYSRWIYNLDDNRALLDLGFPDPGLSSKYTRHYPDTDAGDGVDVGLAGAFYRFITNETMVSAGTSNPYRPYNPNTYLLISAGYDGVYGTDDDITNFNY
jgi:prepilin-type N-terminal cleavage/methylation domain-containing protein